VTSIPSRPGALEAARALLAAGWSLERPPNVRFLSKSDRCALLDEALANVELGAYDQQILDWVADWDTDVAVAIASLITRARQAGQAASSEHSS
jgi:hypothetical protein